ncbi:hypothetical protein LSH36_612g01097 [Paralvinella palmiformis]|uniref:Uncharacterized protein n=1 Tax=Paralvinella palmiformis TaxID=53620 RepID=A0AAD9J5B2_9ANNE|nr:hypothetical protein LSH36_612g01097 [Paralvinella palmiformis]
MSQPATSGTFTPIEGGLDGLSNRLTVSVQEGIPPYKLLMERCRQLEIYNEELTKELRSLMDSTGECSFVTAVLSPSQSIDVVNKLDDVHRLQLLSPSGIEGSPEMSLQDLQEENAMLYATKTELENKLMTAEADRQELEQTVAELKTVQQVDKDNFKLKMDDFQRLLTTVTEAKQEVEHELGRQREEYEDNLQRTRSEKLMELIQDHCKSEAIVKHMTSSEDEVARLRDELRKEREEKEFIRLRNSHLLRECKLYQGHISDLERQVNIQRAEIDEAMEEHKETIRLLAEIRLEQEMCRQEHRGDLSKIEVELQRLESHFGSVCSTPQAMSVVESPECPNMLTQSDVANTTVDTNKVKSVGKNDDGGDGNCDESSKALKQKHYELIDELSRLHRELITIKQFKDNSVKENRQLREALLKEKSSRSQRQSKERLMSAPSHPQLSRSSSVSSLNSLDQSVFDFSTETLALKEKVILLTDARNVLLAENASLQKKLQEQEDLVDELRKCLSGSETSENYLTELDVTNRQITLLQQQRDDLVANVAEMHAKDERINQLAAEKYDLEERLAKEQHLYREKSQQKEMLEVELLKERIEREKQMREYQQLQDMIRQRERIEKQLSAEPTIQEAQSQKTLLVLGETRIREKETILVREKERLASEIAKRVTTRDVKLQVGDTYVPREYRRRATMPKDPTVMGSSDRRRHIRLDCGCQSEVGTMKMYAHCRYHVAVEKLRKELRKQDECRRRKATISAAKDRKI